MQGIKQNFIKDFGCLPFTNQISFYQIKISIKIITIAFVLQSIFQLKNFTTNTISFFELKKKEAD